MEKILNELEQYIASQGGKITFEQMLEQIPASARVNAVNAARSRFVFSLELDNGSFVHYVSLAQEQ